MRSPFTHAIPALLLLTPTSGFIPFPFHSKAITTSTQDMAKRTGVGINQNQNKGFQQYGDINPAYCNLSKDEILNLIKGRNKARRSRNFKEADSILATLNRNNVHLNDKKKLWRADGDVFDIKGYSHMEYTKSSNSKPITPREEEYVNQKLRERSGAKLRRDFDMADDILDELKFLKNIVVDDSACTWRVTEPFKTEYTYGGRRLNNVPDDEIKKIVDLIKDRAEAKSKKNYRVADEILEELKVVCGVRVDDAKKAWFFLPKFDDDRDRFDDGTRRGDREQKRGRRAPNVTRSNNRSNLSDWSEVTVPDGISVSDERKEAAIPDGINISEERNENTIPEGISISNNNDDAMPEGISVSSEYDGQSIPEGIPISNSNIAETNDSSSTIQSLADLTVPLLKEKLRKAGLPVSGRKAELIERLIGEKNI